MQNAGFCRSWGPQILKFSLGSMLPDLPISFRETRGFQDQILASKFCVKNDFTNIVILKLTSISFKTC